MSDLKKNMLLCLGDKKVRVLSVDGERVLVIDCVKKTMPRWIKTEELEEYVECKDIISDDLQDLSAEARKVAYQRYGIIACILPFVDDEDIRAELIEKVAEENDISKQCVRNYLCNYLVMQSIRGLVPKERNNDKPLTVDEKNYRKAINKFYLTSKKRTLKNTYILMLKDSYCDGEGKLLANYPSYYQFRYFARKYIKKQSEIMSREGLSAYQREHRPLVGDGVQSFAPNIGVGMLDSTICDIYLVNDSGEVVGRPYLTACVDAYSGMCLGYSLSWKGGTYSLRDLMLNVVSNKVAHCKTFGIEIKDEWPSYELPGKFVTDMGKEYKGNTFSQITDLGVQMVHLPPFRPDLKSQVEKFFDVVQGYYKPYLKGKGVIEPDFQERGVKDYRKDACLTLEQFETIIVHCILFYNSKRVLENFPYTEDMVERGIKPYPNAIWNYGLNREGANLIKANKEEVVMVLLPRVQGKFTRFGLSVNGMHYHNIQFKEKYLQEGEVEVAYNPDDVGKVWLVEKGEYIAFELIESRFKDKNIGDVEKIREEQLKLVKGELNAKTQAEIDLARHIQTIASVTDKNVISLKNIHQNRKKEESKTHKDFVREVLANV